jgi:hypothetical protein
VGIDVNDGTWKPLGCDCCVTKCARCTCPQVACQLCVEILSFSVSVDGGAADCPPDWFTIPDPFLMVYSEDRSGGPPDGYRTGWLSFIEKFVAQLDCCDTRTGGAACTGPGSMRWAFSWGGSGDAHCPDFTVLDQIDSVSCDLNELLGEHTVTVSGMTGGPPSLPFTISVTYRVTAGPAMCAVRVPCWPGPISRYMQVWTQGGVLATRLGTARWNGSFWDINGISTGPVCNLVGWIKCIGGSFFGHLEYVGGGFGCPAPGTVYFDGPLTASDGFSGGINPPLFSVDGLYLSGTDGVHSTAIQAFTA